MQDIITQGYVFALKTPLKQGIFTPALLNHFDLDELTASDLKSHLTIHETQDDAVSEFMDQNPRPSADGLIDLSEYGLVIVPITRKGDDLTIWDPEAEWKVEIIKTSYSEIADMMMVL